MGYSLVRYITYPILNKFCISYKHLLFYIGGCPQRPGSMAVVFLVQMLQE